MSHDSSRSLARAPLRLAAVVTALLGPVLGTACSAAGGDVAGHASTARDSAGVRIVENAHAASVAAAPATLSPEPLLVLGGAAEAEDPLYRVSSVRRLSDGGIAVANGGSAQLRRYDADGTLRWTSGTKGGGPGEFELLSWAAVVEGDSLLAFDGRSRRFSLFDPAGTFVRSVQPTGRDGQLVSVRPVGLLGDGGVLVSVSNIGSGTPLGGLMRDTVRLLRVSGDGMLGDTIARVPGDERIIRVSPQSIQITIPPFAARFVAAPHGSGSVALEGDAYQLAHRDSAGGLRQLVRLAGTERAATEAMLEAHIERVTGSLTDPAARTSAAEGLRALPRPERLPAVARLLVDPARRVWAMDFLAPGDTLATWRVFDADGRYLGAVPMPAALTVHEIGRDWVLGVYRDEDDVEEVRVYGLDEGR